MVRWVNAGLLFSALWASAAVATKFGLATAQPLVVAVVRFGVAAALMLVFAHGIRRLPLPKGRAWGRIAVYGLLNISVYLGVYVIAMQHVSAGIGSLTIATSPVWITFLSAIFLRTRLTASLLAALAICIAGVTCAAWPLFGTATVTAGGLLLLLAGMFSYSVASLYFSSRDWTGVSLLVINGWQTFFGGLFLLPLAAWFYRPEANHFGRAFWSSVGWLAVPVSIAAVQLWLWLLCADAVRAGLWLFLCPVFGFIFAAALAHEPIGPYTIAGVVLVVAGLSLARWHARSRS